MNQLPVSWKIFRTSLLMVILGSCVTVNVNFPESAVQKATDDYVRELYRAKRGSSEPTPAKPGAKSTQIQWDLIASAWAEEEVFKVNTPKSRDILGRLTKRVEDVIRYKKSGVLGETAQGKLTIKDIGSVSKLAGMKGKAAPLQVTALQNTAKRLVEEENKDRDQLYNEILSANGLPSSRMINIQRSFARSFQAESPSGTWVESPEGQWAQKP